MSSASIKPVPAAFARKHAVRAVSGFATAGLMVGVSLAGASSASAATDTDCTVGNTVDATAAGTPADIQNLIDADTAVICLSGTFVLATSLDYDYDLTLHGLTDAVLDGNGSTQILRDTGSNTLTVESLRVTGGGASEGGAIRGSTVVVHNSQFDNNEADIGGAILADEVSVFDSVFSQNQAILGGAVTVESSFSTTRSTFFANQAEFLGGAIHSYGVVITQSSTFEGNFAGDAGGAILAYGMVTSDASTFVENGADYDGGAIASGDVVDVQNSTFVENVTVDGEGSAIVSSGGSIRQSTFLDNTSDGLGGPAGPAIYVDENTLEVRGNIFAGSSGPAHLGADSQSGLIVDLGANVFTTAEASETALTSVQPNTQFGVTAAAIFAGAVLADNGGPTKTVALHAGSPALSAVPTDASSMTVDQRGVARPAVSDAGAYEFDDGDAASGSGDGAGLAATGSEPSGWLVGTAGLLLAAGVTVLAIVRRKLRNTA